MRPCIALIKSNGTYCIRCVSDLTGLTAMIPQRIAWVRETQCQCGYLWLFDGIYQTCLGTIFWIWIWVHCVCFDDLESNTTKRVILPIKVCDRVNINGPCSQVSPIPFAAMLECLWDGGLWSCMNLLPVDVHSIWVDHWPRVVAGG